MTDSKGLFLQHFKKDTDGNIVYFPWGVLGRGRVIPDQDTRTKIELFLCIFCILSIPPPFICMIFLGKKCLLIILPILGFCYYSGMQFVLSGCPYSKENLTLKESYAIRSSHCTYFTLSVLLVMSFLFFLFGVFMLGVYFIVPSSNGSGMWIPGLAMVITFGASTFFYRYLLKLKKGLNRVSET